MPKKLIAATIVLAGLAGLALYHGATDRARISDPAAVNRSSELAQPAQPAGLSQGQGFVSGAGESEFSTRVRQNTYWQLPFDNRVPGVESVKLVDSLDEWLAGLPPSERLAAEDFVRRNGVALHFETREQQAWLLDRGFPALEEFVAYQRLAESERRSCIPGGGEVCRNEKLAYLSADSLLAEAESMIATASAQDGSLSSSETADALLQKKLSEARAAIGLARGEKSMLYRMHLLLRLNQLDSGIYTEVETARLQSASALAIANFCGDRRMAVPGGSESTAASTTLQLLSASVNVPMTVCGVRPGALWFMPGARGKGALASSD